MKYIPLANTSLRAKVDNIDYDSLNQFNWCLTRKKNLNHVVYAVANVNGRLRLMHKLILPGYQEIDHKDGNGLNNCRSNLRHCSRSENAANTNKRSLPHATSKFKGVHYNPHNNNWRARIVFKGYAIALGSFSKEVDAAKAYNKALKTLFGEFARPNRIP